MEVAVDLHDELLVLIAEVRVGPAALREADRNLRARQRHSGLPQGAQEEAFGVALARSPPRRALLQQRTERSRSVPAGVQGLEPGTKVRDGDQPLASTWSTT